MKRFIPAMLAVLLLGILATAPAYAQVSVTTDAALPAAGIPASIERLSQDGRFAVAESYGPGSSQNNILLCDLTGKRSFQQLSYARAPAFIEGGKALLYWSYDLGGRNGLYLLPLTAGVARRIYPKTDQAENNGSVNGTYGTDWNARTGEVLFVQNVSSGRSAAYALRVRDGRLRLLGTEQGAPWLSPNGEHTVWNRERRYKDRAYGNMLWLSATGQNSRALLSGRLLGWLPNSRDLLLVREGSLRETTSYRYTPSQVLVRLDTLTDRLTFLTETTPQAVVVPSRSGNWIGVLEDHRLRLVRASDGATVAVPREAVGAFAWGRNDADLYLAQKGAWRYLTLRVDTPPVTARTFPSFAPDRISLPPPETHSFVWQAAPEPDTRWQIYTNTGDIRALAAMDGGLMLGTTGGLRLLQANGRENKLPDWARALQGSEISAFATQGTALYLGLQRGMDNGSEEDVLARLDRSTGKLEQTSLGYGRPEGRLEALFAVGPRWIGLTSAGGGLTVWDEAAQTVARWSSQSQSLLARASVALPGPHGTAWIGTGLGLLRWQPGSPTAESWTEKHGLAANSVTALAETGGKLWIGTLAGLSLLDVKTGRILREAGTEALHTATIAQIISTAQTLYVATPDALFARASTTGTWRRLPLPESSLRHFYVTAGELFGSFEAGQPLRKFDASGTWRIVAAAPSGQLPDNRGRIVHAVQGALWCGTDSHLAQWDPRNGTFRSYALPAGSGGIVSISSEGSAVWAVLWKGGAMQIDPASGRVRRWLAQFLTEGWTAPETPNVQAVVPRPDYLYAIAYQGFLRVNRATGKTDRLSLSTLTLGGGYGAATLLQADPDRLWVAAQTEKGARLLQITLPDRKVTASTIPQELLTPGAQEPGRGIWVRQGNALALMSLQGEILTRTPLPSETAFYGRNALLRTDDSLWVAAGSAIHRLNIKSGLWQRYDCPLPNVQSIAILDGSLWTATRHGLARLPLSNSR